MITIPTAELIDSMLANEITTQEFMYFGDARFDRFDRDRPHTLAFQILRIEPHCEMFLLFSLAFYPVEIGEMYGQFWIGYPEVKQLFGPYALPQSLSPDKEEMFILPDPLLFRAPASIQITVHLLRELKYGIGPKGGKRRYRRLTVALIGSKVIAQKKPLKLGTNVQTVA